MIRQAGPSDLDEIATLESECLGQDAWSPGLIREGLAGLPTVTYLVAVDGDTVEGAVVGHAVVSAAGDIAELQRIAVRDSARRGGHASGLLAEVIIRARAERADRLLLEVRENNAGALGFYAARGFVEIDRRPRYYRDGATAIVMRRGLGPSCGGTS